MSETAYKALYLTGRCANGAERDKGRIVHAVVNWRALCGRKPGRTSAGWTTYEQPAVTCPRCISKLAALSPTPILDESGASEGAG